MLDLGTVALGIGITVFLFFSAFFSATEAALLSVNRTRLRFLADQGNVKARRALDLLQKPRRLLATILIGNNIVNIIASVLTTALALQLFGDVGLGIATGVLALALLLAGEITPKSFANDHAEWMALHVSRPITFFVYVFAPIEKVLSAMAKMLLRLTGAARMKKVQFHTEEEIKVLLRVGRERGHIDPHEAELIRAIFEFNDLELADVMRPVGEVVSLRPTETLTRVVELVAQTGHSRYPVIDPANGSPLGLVYAKDFILMSPDQLRTLSVATLLRAIPRFAPDQRVGNALRKMQSEGSQMAAVTNAQGIMIGLVTIEDLLEEIVGEITDEYEAARRRLERDRARLVAHKTQLAAGSTEAPNTPRPPETGGLQPPSTG